MSSLRSVLILAELSHASPRIPTIAKFLSEYGWCATIISGTRGADTDNYRVLTTGLPNTETRIKRLMRISAEDSLQEHLGVGAETRNDPRSALARAMRISKSIVSYPDQHRGWIKVAHAAAINAMRTSHYDVLLSSSSPVSAHIAASRVARETGIPWLADYRDLWSMNHNYQFGQFRRALDRRRELSCLRNASGIVTCTPDWVDSLRRLHGQSDVFLVTNGYDPDLIPRTRFSAPDSLVLASTGPVYPGRHNAETLLAGLSRLVIEKGLAPGALTMRFVGVPDPFVKARVERLGLEEYVFQEGQVSREDSMSIQWGSSALVMFSWANADANGHYPLRAFEYLATAKPILLFTTNPKVAAAQLVMESGCGYLCVDEESTFRTLSVLYDSHMAGTNPPPRTCSPSVAKSSYKVKAKEFAAILSQLVDA